MKAQKQFWFNNNTAELLERILDGGIVVCPQSRLQLFEFGMRGSSIVMDAGDGDGLLRAA
jgi:hypothetical protein